MSAALVWYPRKPNELADDLESFIHVFTLAILRFHEHTLTENTDLVDHISEVYNAINKTHDGYWIGSRLKLRLICNGDPGFDLVKEESHLSVLLKSLWMLGRAHYATLDLNIMQARWGVGPLTKQHLPPTILPNTPEGRPTPWRHLEMKYGQGPRLISPQTSHVENLGDLRSHSAITQMFLAVGSSTWNSANNSAKIADQLGGAAASKSARPSSSVSGMKRSSQAVTVDSGNAGSASKRSRM